MTEKNQLPNYKWIKFNLEYLNDPDFMQLSDAAVGAYLKLYLLAGKADAGGLICNGRVSTIKDIAWYLRANQQTVEEYISELSNAGLVSPDGNGYGITRFPEEQGPGENSQREKWRVRQAKKRAKSTGEDLDQDEDKDEEKEADEEVEVEVDKESHGDVTVTPTNQPTEPLPPPSSAASSSEEIDEKIFLNYWEAWIGTKISKKKLKEFMEVIHGAADIEDWALRLVSCLDVWGAVVSKHKEDGWSKNNPDAMMELFPIPNLEYRMQREGIKWKTPAKEAKRKAILREHGLLEGENEESEDD